MNRFFRPALWTAALSGVLLTVAVTSCSEDEPAPYVLQQTDVTITEPEGGFHLYVDELLRIDVQTVSDFGLTYAWTLNGESIPGGKRLEYMFSEIGEYELVLTVSQGNISYSYPVNVSVSLEQPDTPDEPETPGDSTPKTPYITKVFDFLPAVGQFTNTLPEYEEGDTQETMNEKVLRSIGNNRKGMISLGGFGGYVVVGFDHTIENKAGLRDFRVLANAFQAAANPHPNAPLGGSCEPGVIMVAYDKNHNGYPDDDEWYEIAGSAHEDVTREPWYQLARDNKNDVNLYRNYEITYYRPSKEPASTAEWDTYIRWEDNQGHSGYKVKNQYHKQPYFPLWYQGDKLTFRGTCLPQNGINEATEETEGGMYYVLYRFRYGYADNAPNGDDDSAIDIDWAVNSYGQRVKLPGVDFIKIYSGVNQENGWLGECSTEVLGVEDLHLLGVSIASGH